MVNTSAIFPVPVMLVPEIPATAALLQFTVPVGLVLVSKLNVPPEQTSESGTLTNCATGKTSTVIDSVSIQPLLSVIEIL